MLFHVTLTDHPAALSTDSKAAICNQISITFNDASSVMDSGEVGGWSRGFPAACWE